VDPNVTFLYGGLEPIARVLFIAVSGYVTLLLLLRASGQRTLAQMSALDLVITVTIGSAFGRVLTAREVALSEVVAAFASLVLLQWLVANLWGRTTAIRRYVATTPTLLYYDGEIIDRGMRRHHLVVDDLHAAARQHGMGSLGEARAILLEGNGSLSVLARNQYGDGSALDGLDTGPEAEA
jgi:uncharacterized membrane protein YcaP (DUF421 family)